jgi:DNA-binding beta-propeller fold protein YncE
MIIHLVSSKEVLTVNSSGNTHTVTVRDRQTGKVTTEVFYGKLPDWVGCRG